MTGDRKQVRVAIPADLVKSFHDSKREAENALKVSMTDSQYASTLLRWALKSNDAGPT